MSLPPLPDKVWEQIFEQLNLDDLRSAVNSSRDWKRILDSKKTLYLFPNVIPLLTKYLKRNDILNCRLVCKRWEQGVDEYFESALNLAPYTPARQKQLERREVWQQMEGPRFPYTYYLRWDRWEEEQQDREELQHSRNPHLGRAIAKYGNSYKTGRATGIDHYISAFGHRIKFLDQSWSNEDGTTIAATLINMPNLIQCRIRADFRRRDVDLKHISGILTQLEGLKGKSVLPKLQTLQLGFNHEREFSPYAGTLDNLLISLFCSQLGRLENIRWKAGWNYLDWANLTDLRLYLDNSDTLLSQLEHLNTPKLKKLHLTFESSWSSSSIKQVLLVLRDIPSVESLGVIFDSGAERNESLRKLKGVQFPHIVDLTLNDKPISKEFLQQFPSLRSLQFSSSFQRNPLKFQPNILSSYDPNEERLETFFHELDSIMSRNAHWKIVLAEDGPANQLYSGVKMGDFLPGFSLPSMRHVTIDRIKYFRDDSVKIQMPKSKGFRYNTSEVILDWNWEYFSNGFAATNSFFKNDEVLSPSLLYFHRLEATSKDFESANYSMKKVALYGECFPTVQEILVSHSPILKDFLKCFPNLKRLKIPSVGGYNYRCRSGGDDCKCRICEHKPYPRRLFCRTWRDPILYESYRKKKTVLSSARVGVQNKICESEVWSLLPSLEKISVVDLDENYKVIGEVHVCTRPEMMLSRSTNAKN